MSKKPLKTRDHLMVKVINGVTKAGAHKDLKKEQDRAAARNGFDTELVCQHCNLPFYPEGDELFCSEDCEIEHNWDYDEYISNRS